MCVQLCKISAQWVFIILSVHELQHESSGANVVFNVGTLNSNIKGKIIVKLDY